MSKAKGSVNRSRIVSYQSRVVSMLSFNPPSRHTHQGLMLGSHLTDAAQFYSGDRAVADSQKCVDAAQNENPADSPDRCG